MEFVSGSTGSTQQRSPKKNVVDSASESHLKIQPKKRATTDQQVNVESKQSEYSSTSYSVSTSLQPQDVELKELAKKDRSEIIKYPFIPNADAEYTELILSNMEKELIEGGAVGQGDVFKILIPTINKLQATIEFQSRLTIVSNIEDNQILLDTLLKRLQSFNEQKYFEYADLKGQDLQFVDISKLNLNLSHANFLAANLYCANFSNTNCAHSEFLEAHLKMTIFDCATLPASIKSNETFLQSSTVLQGGEIHFVGEVAQEIRARNNCCGCVVF